MTNELRTALEPVKGFLKTTASHPDNMRLSGENFAGDSWGLTLGDLRRLIAAVEADEWQDIATAPKDGTPILAIQPGFRVSIVWYERMSHHVIGAEDDGRGWVDGNKGFDSQSEYVKYIRRNPTHWRPLPEPPKTDQKGASA